MADSKLRSVADKAEQVTLHRKVAALCETYRVGRYRVPLGHIGFHLTNRGGQAPNGERRLKLRQGILRVG